MKDNIEILKDWLVSPLYWRGVDLYELHGESAFLKNLFKSAEDDYNRDKLIEAITSIVENMEMEEQAVIEDMPDSLRTKLDDAKSQMDTRAALKERLRVYYHQNASHELCKAVAHEILNINDKLNDIYNEQRFYKTTGYLPERAQFEADSIPELVKRRNTLRTYVSRTTNKEKLEGFKKELFAIEKRIEVLTPKQ